MPASFAISTIRSNPGETAGLTTLLRFDSSVHWMQRADQAWSWQNARDRYYAALVSTVTSAASQGQRVKAFADTFRALGQVMHLVVDASVPEHTRNDIHPLGPLYGSYEYWVEAQHGLQARRPRARSSTTSSYF